MQMEVGEDKVIPVEYLEWRFCKMFQCTPKDLEREDWNTLTLYAGFMEMEQKADEMHAKRKQNMA